MALDTPILEEAVINLDQLPLRTTKEELQKYLRSVPALYRVVSTNEGGLSGFAYLDRKVFSPRGWMSEAALHAFSRMSIWVCSVVRTAGGILVTRLIIV